MGARNSKQPSNKIAIVVKATEPIEYLDVETTGFEQAVTVRKRNRVTVSQHPIAIDYPGSSPLHSACGAPGSALVPTH